MPLGTEVDLGPSNAMWPGPRPTSVPSFILIHPTIWPQYTNVRVRTDNGLMAQGKPFYKRSPKNDILINPVFIGSLVVKALDLQLSGCEFNSRPRVVNKLFTPTCLSRSQWFSDGMIDCGVRGRGQLSIVAATVMYSLGHGLRTFLQCLG